MPPEQIKPDYAKPESFLVGQDGKFAEGWLNNPAIPEDLRADKTLAAVTDFPSMAKMLVNAQQVIGQDKVVIPKADAPSQEWDAYFKGAGWPDTPDKYQAPAKDPNAPADLVWNEDLFKAFAKEMHTHHYTQDQITAAVAFMNQRAIADHAEYTNAQTESVKKAIEANRKAWGAQYPMKLQLADQAAAAFIDKDDLSYLQGKGLLADPVVQRVFAKIGEAITPERMRGISGPGQSSESVQDQINSVMGDPKSPYFDGRHPQHAATVTKVQKLFQELHKETN